MTVPREDGQLVQRGVWSLSVVSRPAPLTPYAYTHGLFAHFGHPELVVAGLRESQRTELLDVAGELVSDGECLRSGTESWKIADGYPARFRPVDPRIVRSRLPRIPADAPVLQLFWPDPAGRFPWMDGCDPAVIATQRV
jgi:hypothetical protein